MTTTTGSRPHSPETPKSATKTAEKRNSRIGSVAKAGVIGLLGFGVVMAYISGETSGKRSRDTEVTDLQKVNHAQDWVIDNDINNVAKDNGVYEQGGNVYVRFEDASCKAPVVFQYDERQNAAVLNQTDQAGNIYASAKITNAGNAVAVVHDICT